ncbi:MAG: DUF4019 domain-containing protein [Armatimonadota bacterium]|nr:DUF4019 domain-containing protein [Armatimonadota bacterium]
MTKTTLWALGLSAALLAGLSLAGCGNQTATPTGVAPAPPYPVANHALDKVASAIRKNGGYYGTRSGTRAMDREDEDYLAAEKAAQSWLALLDSAKYAQSWKTAAPVFQKATTADFWATTVQAVREPLGKLQSRTGAGGQSQYRRTLPGAPDGDYWILRYHSTFAKKQKAMESVTTMRTPDGQWKVSGYYIQ